MFYLYGIVISLDLLPYLFKNSKTTPFVQPNPVCEKYSPPAPVFPAAKTSYWNSGRINKSDLLQKQQVGLGQIRFDKIRLERKRLNTDIWLVSSDVYYWGCEFIGKCIPFFSWQFNVALLTHTSSHAKQQ